VKKVSAGYRNAVKRTEQAIKRGNKTRTAFIARVLRATPHKICYVCGRLVWLRKGTNKFVTHGPGKDGAFTCKGSGMEAN